MLSSFSVCIMSSVTDAPIPGCPAPPNGLPRMPLPPPSMHRCRSQPATQLLEQPEVPPLPPAQWGWGGVKRRCSPGGQAGHRPGEGAGLSAALASAASSSSNLS